MSHVGLFFNKAIVPIDYANMSFKPNIKLLDLPDSSSLITLVEGKILKNATTAPSNHITDSIRIVFQSDDDEPKINYILKGYKNTGWPEDRHD